MARALQAALKSAKAEVTLASRFQSRDRDGDAVTQNRLFEQAKAEIERVTSQGRAAGWDVWITYHNYYKAPDLLGPYVAEALRIPYILVEATRAKKRLSGPWARFAAAAEAATDAAAAVLYMTQHDAEALHKYRYADQIIAHLPPFLATDVLPPESTREGSMLSVGMMRTGDKLSSFRLIAETLSKLETRDWNLLIAGDGPTRRDVEEFMAPFANRVTLLGRLGPDELLRAYAESSIFFWPGINEAFGIAYLEAQASGLAVVAQDRPGVRDVLAPGAAYPPPEAGAGALAARLDMLLSMPKLNKHIGQAARRHVSRTHLLSPASARLSAVLSDVVP
ncbi:MAG: glycosyltransferase family 4 protein [Paracoccaceae bacterium]